MQLTITHVSGLKQGERETFTTFPVTIGRAPGNQMRLAANDTRASARHAEVVLEGNQLFLIDLKSTNGTYLNGQKIDRVKLVNSDIIEFGIDGPKLKFEFVTEEKANILSAAAPQTVPVRPAAGPPPLAIQPAGGPGGNSPQFGIASKQGPELAVAPPPGAPAPMLEIPLAIEEQEFPYKNRFKLLLFGAGSILVVTAIVLFIKQLLIATAPALLIGTFLILMGWSFSRINITVSNQGVHFQSITRSTLIRWEDITELRVVRGGRTRLLTHLVYVVRGRNNEIVFAVEDYENGMELANLISKRSRMSW